ncbi:MAG: metallophosphoesterase [Calditrichaeota bacterium]|nr:MAG: metallophosphoesterase [Calditrichota bacterium]MBL1206354.1 metallophosphoesterase [Calditrichota bacterium]NOG46180.1 metallophosphoesterase family protein [Calditrichota bacterium]
MKHLIFSDLHANLYGLEKVLEYASSNNINKIYCLGDLIGYNSFANECVDLIKKNNIKSIKGNHECLLLGEISMDTCKTERSQNAINVTQNLITKENSAFLKDLPVEMNIEDSICVHAGFHSIYETINTFNKAQPNFNVLQKRGHKIAFFGHTHRPGVYSKKIGTENIDQIGFEKTLFLDDQNLYLINPGTCGEPRHGLPYSFIVYDDEQKSIDFEIFQLSANQMESVKKNNRKIFGTTSFKRLPNQVKEKSRKLYYKIGKIKDNFSGRSI